MAAAAGLRATRGASVLPARGDRGGANARARRISQIQRARLIAAMTHVACRHGGASATVAEVVNQAGVSRRTFYELFANCEECLLAALADALGIARERVILESARAAGGWRAQIRAGLAGLLALFDERPEIARLLVVESLAAGPVAIECRRQTLAELERAVDEKARQGRSGRATPHFAARAAVGAALSALHSALLEEDRRGSLQELAGQLMSMLMMPYLGPAAAGRELERQTPSHERTAGASHVPLQALKMRITYRTLAVLSAIAASPGASNRAIAGAAGIRDQGQASKLLTRLQRLGLIENSETSPAVRGVANAWTLTAEGQRIERSLRA
jgi:AcrR family transcriptional regulator/DNA-binding MarR family transcriptional regulator